MRAPAVGILAPTGAFLGAMPVGGLVGREEEMARIQRAVEAVEAGSGRVVLLTGESGIGKTRLAQEVTVDLRDRGGSGALEIRYASHSELDRIVSAILGDG